jgi:hypothetical protein
MSIVNKKDNFRGAYPLISDYTYNINKISLEESYLFSVANSESDDKNVKRFIRYNSIYNYDGIGDKQLCILTHFIKLYKIEEKKNNVIVHIDISDVNTNNITFKNIINDIMNKIRDNIIKEYPAIQINLPYFASNSGETLLPLLLISRKKQKDDSFKTIDTPIYIHRSKKKGGDIITIENEHINNILTNIAKECSGIKTPSKGEIFYEAKASLIFCANVSINNNVQVCDIKIYAKEMEIKYNVSYVKSVLNKDLTIVTQSKNKNIDRLTL